MEKVTTGIFDVKPVTWSDIRNRSRSPFSEDRERQGGEAWQRNQHDDDHLPLVCVLFYFFCLSPARVSIPRQIQLNVGLHHHLSFFALSDTRVVQVPVCRFIGGRCSTPSNLATAFGSAQLSIGRSRNFKMLEITPPTRIPMFPSNYREFFLTPAAPQIPLAQQTLQPGQIFQLAQPKWPVDSVMPSFYLLAATTIFAALFLVAFKDLGALINYIFHSKLGIAGHPVLGMTLSLLSATMLLTTYENDIKKRSGYYSDGSDPRYTVAFSAVATVCCILWASGTFQTPVTASTEKEKEDAVKEGGRTKDEARGSRRQQKKQAKREAKKLTAQRD